MPTPVELALARELAHAATLVEAARTLAIVNGNGPNEVTFTKGLARIRAVLAWFTEATKAAQRPPSSPTSPPRTLGSEKETWGSAGLSERGEP